MISLKCCLNHSSHRSVADGSRLSATDARINFILLPEYSLAVSRGLAASLRNGLLDTSGPVRPSRLGRRTGVSEFAFRYPPAEQTCNGCMRVDSFRQSAESRPRPLRNLATLHQLPNGFDQQPLPTAENRTPPTLAPNHPRSNGWLFR